mgnify:CR=1 FL=1
MTDYANWFAYYHARITAVKTVTSLTFLGKLRQYVQPRRHVPRRVAHLVEQEARHVGQFRPRPRSSTFRTSDADRKKRRGMPSCWPIKHSAGPGNADVECDVADRRMLRTG